MPLLLLACFALLAPAILCLVAAFLWFIRPDLVVKWGIWYGFHSTGMKNHRIRGKKYEYVYGERGTADPNNTSLLFIHGFSASKEMWGPIVKRLPNYLHIIAIDLPGHGDSETPGKDDQVSTEEYVDNIHEFVELIGFTKKPFHMIGTSLGGIIAAIYAIHHVKNIERLTLICPGTRTPETCDFMKGMLEGKGSLVPTTVEEMKYMLDSCYFNKDAIPMYKQILKGSLILREAKNPFFRRLLHSIVEDMKDDSKFNKFEVESRQITCPVQLIWGKEDQVIHTSGVEYLQKLLPNIQKIDIIDKCGHSVGIERAGKTVKLILMFRDELANKKEN
ncbi:hypothetical protein LSH36_278g05008 [Paralvinella palmiformis]|uniref:acylglycerol lipase n=1 Tax=Paralvinella palmiformis TaxID=53620 RepID=A0AAD9N291_9ANNE|nr:hypothetical protein LSH36_278g05008 [Paralvinella palmiformis]